MQIVESYKNYVPDCRVRASVDRLLSAVPGGYLSGLQAVVLTNSARIERGKTRRYSGRKYCRSECRGRYHPGWKRGLPWIELVVDNIIATVPPVLLRIRVFADMAFGYTLYHELGHHLCETIGSLGRHDEDGANKWRTKLSRSFMRKHYWYLTPVLGILFRSGIFRYLRRHTLGHTGHA
ncbi:MAG: hypothetical protein EHM23_34820 [Acidobacteria bacterium]|nr:MAG: hypothetical protein EHM23_34820 [Acidobacteriota bacterium]